jgi:hypothetical protein
MTAFDNKIMTRKKMDQIYDLCLHVANDEQRLKQGCPVLASTDRKNPMWCQPGAAFCHEDDDLL